MDTQKKTISTEVRFKDAAIFGANFRPDVSKAKRSILDMLLNGVLEFDGTIIVERKINAVTSQVTRTNYLLDRRDLWTYIWYMWRTNHETVPVFRDMLDNHRPKANSPSPARFIQVVKQTLNLSATASLSVTDLAQFINRVVQSTEYPVKIYLLHELYRRLIRRLEQEETLLSRKLDKVNARINNAQHDAEFRPAHRLHIDVTNSSVSGQGVLGRGFGTSPVQTRPY